MTEVPLGDADPASDSAGASVADVAPAEGGSPLHAALATWANRREEWVRYLVGLVLISRRALDDSELEHAYELLRQEKGLDSRTMSATPPLLVSEQPNEIDEPLRITRLANVAGVNALVPGAVIDPHAGLTILFGENGTGKTGYARIFKAVAGSPTAEPILGDIATEVETVPSATISYTLGGQVRDLDWRGERAEPPLTRISIFDNPSVNLRVDDDLEYVYVPTTLALFNHIVSAIKSVQAKIDMAAARLSGDTAVLAARFPKESDLYPMVETLGASTDLEELRSHAEDDPHIEERIEAARNSVAALEAGSLSGQIRWRQHFVHVLQRAADVSAVLEAFSHDSYNEQVVRLAQLRDDFTRFRTTMFAVADLPAEPDDSWEDFVLSGKVYREHLQESGVHDDERCLYCRQPLSPPAAHLLGTYAEYLADGINGEIATLAATIGACTSDLFDLDAGEVLAFIGEYTDRDDKPDFLAALTRLTQTLSAVRTVVTEGRPVPVDAIQGIPSIKTELGVREGQLAEEVRVLQEQSASREAVLVEKRKEVSQLLAAQELSRSWSEIESYVANSTEADRLTAFSGTVPALSREITELAKAASDRLVNDNFETLFREESAALRAPHLEVEFIGRQGKAQRRKVLSRSHRTSAVLSEGEQKALALADFFAEARLGGISAPVIFDDPVSSLDHRRISEVAHRVFLLSGETQVLVFTHDILFAATLLGLAEATKRCTYYQVSDEGGKGEVTLSTGPRWDTISVMKKNINETIQAARSSDGATRAELIRTAYSWIRSWCEVFTENELLAGVTERYQPNVRMTALSKINLDELGTASAVVVKIWEGACRFTEAHSQPLASLGVGPTLAGLEAHWDELQECRKTYLAN